MKTILTLIAIIIINVSFSQNYNGCIIRTTIAGIGEGRLSSQEIINAGKLEVCDKSISIKKFDMSFVSKGQIVSLSSNSSELTKEMLEALKTGIMTGSPVFFEAIEGVDKDANTVKLAGATIRIK